MAQRTAGKIVICKDGKAYHTIIKMDLNAVKMWNDSHKSKLFVCNDANGKFYDCDAYHYADSFTNDNFWRKGDADLMIKIAKKYNLETYEIRYNRFNTFEKHWKRCNGSQTFDINKYYESHKQELKQKAQEARNAKEFKQFQNDFTFKLGTLANNIKLSFNNNIMNDDFYYNHVLNDVKELYINATKKFNKMSSGELKPNPKQLNNYILLISELLKTINKYNNTWHLEDGSKEKKIAEACYYSSKNNCNWKDAETTSNLILNVEGK
jgi:hypothetical protein